MMEDYVSTQRLGEDIEDTRVLLRTIMLWWGLSAVACLICLHLVITSTGLLSVVWFLVQFVTAAAFFILNREMWMLVRRLRALGAQARFHLAIQRGTRT